MEMKISIFCILALLASSLAATEVQDHSLYSAGEGTPVFAFQSVLRSPLRKESHGDSEKELRESTGANEYLQGEEEDNNESRIKRAADSRDDKGKGGVEVDINRERGQGTRVDASVSRRVWESNDGRGRVDVHGNYGRTYGGPGGTGRPNYGGRITYSHRFRREANPEEEKDRGNVDVNVNRERGQGTRVDVTAAGKVWESRDGNGRVDVHGNYGRTYGGPGGTGRPNYGGRITYSHRFRREANPGDEKDRGSVDVNVNRERGQGTRVDVTASGRVWESRDGNGRVDVHGNYGRTYGGPGGTGRPNYGGRITYSHRFRREANPGDEKDRGSVDVNVNRERGQGTRVDVTASGKVWESRDGNGRVDVHGNYGRTYGGPGGTSRPNYGGGISYSHRFRRSLQPRDEGRTGSTGDRDEGRGNIDIKVDRQRGQGTRVDVAGSGKVWESQDGNGGVDVHGNYGRTYGGPGGTGRPSYGGGITYSHRFRREANPGDEKDKGSVDINVNRERGQGTRVDATASGKVWESRDGNGRVDVYGNYGRTYGGPGGTSRPNYGGRITYSHRFRRSLQPRDEGGRESARGDDGGRGSLDVNVDRQRGQGTRVDVTGSGRVWESNDGRGRVDVHGNYGRTYGGPGGTGRPNYGGRITYSHRFRREANPGEEKDRGNVDINVNRERGQGTRVDVTASGKVWESRDGNGRVDVHGNYGRTYGGPGGTGRPNYGGRITYSHRFRRSLQPRDEDRRESTRDKDGGRGNIDVNVDRQRGQGTRVDVTGSGRVWESRDGNGRLDVHGNYGRTYGGPEGTGRPQYGGGIIYTHRFRRDALAEEEQEHDLLEDFETEFESEEDDDAARAKREAGPREKEDRGRVEVDINRERGQGTRVDARATGKVWESRDGNGRLEVQGNYGRTFGGPDGTGRPNYGGRINYSHRF